MGNQNDTDKALVSLGKAFKIFAAVATVLIIGLVAYIAANASKAEAAQSIFNARREIPIAGVLPGTSLEEVIAAWGNPVLREGDELIFSNSVKVELNHSRNVVEEMKTRSSVVTTPEGLAVGMSENKITATYGTADKVKREHDGEVEYKYYSADGTKSFKFVVRGGVIVEMKSELRD